MKTLLPAIILLALTGCSTMNTIASQWSMGETRVTNHTFGGYSVRATP